MFFRFITFLFFWALAGNHLAYAEQLIIEPEMGRAPLLEKINHAQHNIELVIYGFTDKTLLNALIKQKQAGKDIKVILEDRPYRYSLQNDSTIETLNRYHIPWQGKIPGIQFIHQKTLIIDHQEAVVMTFNFTHSSFKQQRNFGLVIDNPGLVKAIDNVFAADWQHTPPPELPSELIYSPENSYRQFLPLIEHAKQQIDIYAQSISDYDIVGALAKAAKRHVTVRVLTSAPLNDKPATYLTKATVIFKKCKRPYIHAKVMLIDNTIAVIGSTNFTATSMQKNRELSVITKDEKIIQQLNSQFNLDWRSC